MKIEQIIKKCKQNNPEFEFKGKLLFIPPISQVLTGFYFEKVKDHFYLWKFAQPLFIVEENYYFTFGQRIKNPITNSYMFEFSDQPYEVVQRIISDTENLNWLRELKNVNTFYEFYKTKITDYTYLRNLAFVSAYLNTDDSNHHLKEFIRLSKIEIDEGYSDYLVSEVDRAQKILSSSKVERLDLFDSWREETIKNLKL